MDAVELYRALLTRDIAPVLRENGFRGTRPTWRLSSDRGDTAIVNAQTSTSSTRELVRFTVNVAVVPAPTWAWEQIRLGSAAGQLPSTSHRAAWWTRVGPDREPNGADGWHRVSDERSAEACAIELCARLRDKVVPTLRRLLDREELIAALRAGDVGFLTGNAARVRADLTLAAVLADEGRTLEMEEVIGRMLARTPDGLIDYVAWVRQRAAS